MCHIHFCPFLVKNGIFYQYFEIASLVLAEILPICARYGRKIELKRSYGRPPELKGYYITYNISQSYFWLQCYKSRWVNVNCHYRKIVPFYDARPKINSRVIEQTSAGIYWSAGASQDWDL